MSIADGKSEYSKAQADALLSEVMDKNRVLLACKRHSYVASETPPKPTGCVDCAKAYWWHKIASTPPHLRRERVEEAIRVIRAAVESYERGEFDFEVSERPIISTETDA